MSPSLIINVSYGLEWESDPRREPRRVLAAADTPPGTSYVRVEVEPSGCHVYDARRNLI